MKAVKSKRERFTRSAWAYTRLRLHGVWRYLRSVDEVISPRFLFLSTILPLGLNTNKYYLKDLIMGNLKSQYESELRAKGVSNEDIQFILNLITEWDEDENLCRMDNDYWKKLEERGLLEIFEEISEEQGIKWTHSNDDWRYR